MPKKSPVLLFVDATLKRQKSSRTYQICQAYLNEFKRVHPEYQIRHLHLYDEALSPVTAADIETREELTRAGRFDHPDLQYAAEFAGADAILIGAPYWELSFPAVLKIYIERVSVCQVAFCYTESGSKGLCRATSLTYITSCGGHPGKFDLGTEYLKGMCEVLFGIPVFQNVCAGGLDIDGADVEGILTQACQNAEALARINEKGETL